MITTKSQCHFLRRWWNSSDQLSDSTETCAKTRSISSDRRSNERPLFEKCPGLPRDIGWSMQGHVVPFLHLENSRDRFRFEVGYSFAARIMKYRPQRKLPNVTVSSVLYDRVAVAEERESCLKRTTNAPVYLAACREMITQTWRVCW